ncbi:MAG: Na-translocating system protein MpsC family protein [Peptococcaceae bacterium]|nr:Na-translocating system protein MpsC family protein [Peptococcaceae bacterium]MDH7524816.1 Na-translocating system protein MpsC family protein [Peptococcaceae bacterium]
MLLGEFKQEIMRLNNKVNMEIFSQGLRWQKVEIIDDKVFIIANNKRLRGLDALDPVDRLTTKLIDLALILEFKDRFIKTVEEALKVKILAHLKDYDPYTEISFSVTIFEKKVDELIKEIKL